MSTISVIITSFNYAQYLPKCLNSIFSQTRKPDEVLVIDDHSTDNTDEIIRSYNRKVKFIRHKTNWGNVCKTFNQGIKKARGDYIMIISADDWLGKKIIEREAAILDKNPEVGLVYTQNFVVKDGKKSLVVHKPAGESSYIGRKQDLGLLLMYGNFIPAPTVLVRKKVYKKVGLFNPNLPLTADLEMWVRVAKHYPLAYIAEPMSFYRIHGKNVHLVRKGAKEKWAYERRRLLEQYLPKDNSEESQFLNKLAFRNYYLWLAAQEAFAHNPRKTVDYLFKAVKLMPNYMFKWSTWQPFYFLVRERFIRKIISK